MKTGDCKTLLTVTGLITESGTFLRLPERQDASQAEIWARLAARTYEKPIVVDDPANRSLCFTIDGSVQSEMRLDDPTALVSEYTRTMMAFLLFCAQPRHVVMLGLGGGSLVKFCRERLPETCMTVAEIDPAVIALRTYFHVPPDDTLLRIVQADGGQHVAQMAQSGESIDVLLVDAYDRNGLAHSTGCLEFFENARAVLGRDGVFVMNFAAYESEPAQLLPLMRQAFGEPVIPAVVGWGGNTVVFAGPALRQAGVRSVMPARAAQLRTTLGLDFANLAEFIGERLAEVDAGEFPAVPSDASAGQASDLA